ncbi:hypothetical protein ABTN56_19380 [Acinetobacter baumannii]
MCSSDLVDGDTVTATDAAGNVGNDTAVVTDRTGVVSGPRVREVV